MYLYYLCWLHLSTFVSWLLQPTLKRKIDLLFFVNSRKPKQKMDQKDDIEKLVNERIHALWDALVTDNMTSARFMCEYQWVFNFTTSDDERCALIYNIVVGVMLEKVSTVPRDVFLKSCQSLQRITAWLHRYYIPHNRLLSIYEAGTALV